MEEKANDKGIVYTNGKSATAPWFDQCFVCFSRLPSAAATILRACGKLASAAQRCIVDGYLNREESAHDLAAIDRLISGRERVARMGNNLTITIEPSLFGFSLGLGIELGIVGLGI